MKRIVGVTGRMLLGGILGAGMLPGSVRGQTDAPSDVRLQGVVVDQATYQPIAAATVTLVGTDLEVRTGRWGSFTFPDAPVGDVSVRVIAPGHPSVEVQVQVKGGRVAFVQVVLPSVAAMLSELRVGAAAPVLAPVDGAQTAADLLALQVPRTRTAPSMVGDNDFQVRLRAASTLSGSGEPMVVIDGAVMGGDVAYQALSSIPAEDVEQIEVLRGPATTALYPYAANGVIRVTTKRGVRR